jgi:hypothetical protein
MHYKVLLSSLQLLCFVQSSTSFCWMCTGRYVGRLVTVSCGLSHGLLKTGPQADFSLHNGSSETAELVSLLMRIGFYP